MTKTQTLPAGTQITYNGKTGTLIGFDNQRGPLSSHQYFVKWADGRTQLISAQIVHKSAR